MIPDLLRGTSKSIGGDLNVDDEGSEYCQFEPVQSLHHCSVVYQPMHTRIGLAKKAMSLQMNQKYSLHLPVHVLQLRKNWPLHQRLSSAQAGQCTSCFSYWGEPA
jgi:hypothetical protein